MSYSQPESEEAPQTKRFLGLRVAVILTCLFVGLLFTFGVMPTDSPKPAVSPTPPATSSPTPSPTASPTPKPPVTPCGPTIYKPDGTPWRCAFDEEFSGSALDTTKWSLLTTAATGLRGSGDDCWLNSPYNVAVDGGTLHIATRKEAQPFACKVLGGSTYVTQYSSGGITTSGKFNQAFGRFEFRAKFPAGAFPGIQTSLWMHPAKLRYGPWPASGEIDVAEYYSVNPDRVVPYVHYFPKGADPVVTNNRCLVPSPWQFHTYAAEWTYGRIVISVDGRVCLDHHIDAKAPLDGTQPFDQPFSIHISQGLGSRQNKLSPNLPLPLVTQVDWVHVWA